ncbi:MAG: signal peptidase I [Bacillota bacterium]
MFKNILALMAVILLGAMIITPFGPAHVISGSMEPEISAGSTIFLYPAAEIQTGDVIVFYPTGLDREMIVHRVVDETAEGFITRGDAAAKTDQEMGEPPIHIDRVTGKVLSVDGSIVQTNYRSFVLTTLGLCLVIAFFWAASSSKLLQKKRLRVKHVQLFILIFCGVILVFTMILGSGTEAVSFLASENPGTRTDHTRVGEPGEMKFTVSNRSVIPTLVYVEGPESVSSIFVLPLSTAETNVTIPARDEPGWYEISVNKYSHPAVLPPVVIDLLYRVSPYLSMLAVLALMIFIIYLILMTVEPWIPLSHLGGKSLVRSYRRLKRSFVP